MSNRVKNADQKWVVYVHYDDSEVVYLGSGQVHRAFQFIKRDEEHYDWMVEKSLSNLTADFCQIVFVTKDYDEARFVESRLIAENSPRFNKQNTKLTFQDLKDCRRKIQDGMSLRSCASEVGIAHNNLRLALKQPYVENEYNIVI